MQCRQAASQRLQQLALWLLELAARNAPGGRWPDMQTSMRSQVVRKPRRAMLPLREPSQGGHSWSWRGCSWQCCVCGAKTRAAEDGSLQVLPEHRRRQVCRGAVEALRVVSRLAGQACMPPGAGHKLWRTGEIVFCSRCASYTEARYQGLQRPCTAAPHVTQLRRLMCGRPVSYTHLRAHETLSDL
eukprot:11208044-Karenia_brevis.AAC.1